MMALVSFTLQRELRISMQKPRLLGYWPAGFISTGFYLSKIVQVLGQCFLNA